MCIRPIIASAARGDATLAPDCRVYFKGFCVHRPSSGITPLTRPYSGWDLSHIIYYGYRLIVFTRCGGSKRRYSPSDRPGPRFCSRHRLYLQLHLRQYYYHFMLLCGICQRWTIIIAAIMYVSEIRPRFLTTAIASSGVGSRGSPLCYTRVCNGPYMESKTNGGDGVNTTIQHTLSGTMITSARGDNGTDTTTTTTKWTEDEQRKLHNLLLLLLLYRQ